MSWVVSTCAYRTWRIDGRTDLWYEETIPIHALAEILSPTGPITTDGAVRLVSAVFGRPLRSPGREETPAEVSPAEVPSDVSRDGS